MVTLEHLSYSSINSYLLCGHAWRLRYVDRVETPILPALLVGSAFHDAIESYISGQIPDLENAFEQSWGKQLERGQTVAWDAETPESYKSDGLRLVRAKPVKALADTLRQNFDPETCYIEKRVELKVPGVPVPVVGYIDIITHDGIPGDFKTAVRMWSDSKSGGELQPLFYLAALSQEGQRVPGWTFRHYVISKGQYPDAKTFEVQHKPGELFWLFEMLKAAWQGIEANIFPMNPSAWKCSQQYCEYWSMCRGKWQ